MLLDYVLARLDRQEVTHALVLEVLRRVRVIHHVYVRLTMCIGVLCRQKLLP